LLRAFLGIRIYFVFRDYIDRVGFHVICRITVLCVCCLLALPVSAGDDLWEWVTPWPQGHNLYAAAIGGSVTVAVGERGTAITSTDGIEWRTRHTGGGYSLSDVVWANGLFVAVGGTVGFEISPGLGVILTSDDGINWIERHREDYLTLEAVVWTGTRFVAVGIGDRALVSSDGLIWSEVELGGSQFIWDLAWNGSQLVALGRRGYVFGTPTFFTSENGEAWQQIAIEREYAPSSIAVSGGRFVAVGSEHDALVSDDGMTWTEAPYDAPGELGVIVGGGDGFVATGWGVVGTSHDGFVWSTNERPREYRIGGLAWLGDGYLAVGEDGFMMSSPDGSEWTQLSTRFFDPWDSWEISGLATNGSTVVGVGEGGVVFTGKHGTEWELQWPAHSWLTSVIWTGSAFWAAGGKDVLRSVDGVQWSQIHNDSDIRLFDMDWNGSLFVAVGRHSTRVGDGWANRRVVLTSSDGDDWSSQYFDDEGILFTVGWTGSHFVAAGSGTVYLTSPDGVDWQRHTQPEDLELTNMASNGDRLVAVGGRWQAGGVIRSTTDGVHWVESALSEDEVSSFNDVTWTGTHFVAVPGSNADSILLSADGISWLSEFTGTGVYPLSVAGDERGLFIAGRDSQIIRRTKPLGNPVPPRRSGRRVEPVGEKLRVGPATQE